MAEAATQSFLAGPVETIDVGAAQLPVRRFGKGPPLLLVHGFPLWGFTWRKVLSSLAEHFTCWVPDLPGMGGSQWSDAADFTWDGQARTLKTLMDRVGAARYAVAGHDTGGTFARRLALMDPRVERVVVINSEIPQHRPPWIPLYQHVIALPGSIAGFQTLLRSRLFLRSSMGFGGCFADLSLLDGDFHEHFVRPLLASRRRMEGLRAYLRSLRWEVVDALAEDHRRLTMPVKLIWGADDPTFPVAEARGMLSQLPNATLAELAGGKLLVHEEKPMEVAAEMVAFLRN